MFNTTLKHLPYVLFVMILMTACLFAGGTAFADPLGRKHAIPRHEAHHARVVANRHDGHHRPYVRRVKHYYPRRHFYRTRPHFSLFIGAPLGTFFTTLPAGQTRAVVHGAPYYLASGVYYQQVLGGYRVVQAPRDVVVFTSPPADRSLPAIQPEEVQVSAAALNVRTGPGLQYSVIAQVQRGDSLRVVSSAPGWLCVQIGPDQTGWIMDSFTAPVTGPASG